MSASAESSDDEDWTSTSWAAPLVTVATMPNISTTSVSLSSKQAGKMVSVGSVTTSVSHASSGQPQGMTSVTEEAKLSNSSHDTSVESTTVAEEGAKASDMLVSTMKLNDNKAGMQGLDRAKINQIIYEASKGSRYYENEQKKEQQIKLRINHQQQQLNVLTAQQITHAEVQADLLLEKLEQGRDLSRTIVHIDMDAFYAAVEMRDKPELRNKPMAVGGNSMLSTSNYLARRYGVRAAMPGFIGKKLCPSLVIVPANFGEYHRISTQVREIMAEYDPDFCPMSLDEAYLDITAHLEKRLNMTDEERTYTRRIFTGFCACHVRDVSLPNAKAGMDSLNEQDRTRVDDHHESEPVVAPSEESSGEANNENIEVASATDEQPCSGGICPKCSCEFAPRREEIVTFAADAEGAVNELRFRIEQRTQLTASAGIAPNTLIAKVCSDMNKPNGQYVVPASREAVLQFINKLSIRKVSGIGKVTEHMLSALGVTMCSNLHKHRGVLHHLYSPTSFHQFMRIALGIGSTVVQRDGERKSMSVERTFSEIHVPSELYEKCQELSQSLADDLAQENLMGKTVTIKLKTVSFEVRTRAQTLGNWSQSVDQIYAAASSLLRTEIQSALPGPLKLRLMGVRMSNLVPANQKPAGCISIVDAFKKVKENTVSVPTQSESEAVAQPPHASSPPPPTDGDSNTQMPYGSIQKNQSSGLKSPASKDVFTCPVCQRDIKSKSLKIVNIHVDRCLRGMNSSASDEQKLSLRRGHSSGSPENIRNEGKLKTPPKHKNASGGLGSPKLSPDAECLLQETSVSDLVDVSGKYGHKAKPGADPCCLSAQTADENKANPLMKQPSGYSADGIMQGVADLIDTAGTQHCTAVSEMCTVSRESCVEGTTELSRSVTVEAASASYQQQNSRKRSDGEDVISAGTDETDSACPVPSGIGDMNVAENNNLVRNDCLQNCIQSESESRQNSPPSWTMSTDSKHGVMAEIDHATHSKKSDERNTERRMKNEVICSQPQFDTIEKRDGEIDTVTETVTHNDTDGGDSIDIAESSLERIQNCADPRNHLDDAQASSSCLSCPICGEICDMDLPAFNAHINHCLNKKESYSETSNQGKTQTSESQPKTDDLCRVARSPAGVGLASDGLISACDTSSARDVQLHTDVKMASDAESDDEGSSFICPICNIDRDVSSLDELNTHIDDCLNKRTVMDLVREENRTHCNKRRRESGGGLLDQVTKKRKESGPHIRPISTYFLSQQ